MSQLKLIHFSSLPPTPPRYILSLLNKFEVALTWDLRTLLIPSLLPLTEDEPENTITLKVFFNDSSESNVSYGFSDNV